MAIINPAGYEGGLHLLDEWAAELAAELRVMPGICQQCVEDEGNVWPERSAYLFAPCQSCDSKEARKLMPYDAIQEAQ